MGKKLVRFTVYLPQRIAAEFRKQIPRGRRNRWVLKCIVRALGAEGLMQHYRGPGRPAQAAEKRRKKRRAKN